MIKRKTDNTIYKKKTHTATLLAIALTASALGTTGCSSPFSSQEETTSTESSSALSIAISADILATNPFAIEEGADEALLKLTQLSLLEEGHTEDNIETASQADTSPAVISASYDKAKKQTTCTISLREDLLCSDGTPLTADDLIFNYYVLCDTSYTGDSKVSSVPILGLDAYICGTKNVAAYQKAVKAELAEPSNATKKQLQKQIIEKALKEQYEWVESLFEDENYSSYTKKYTTAPELFSYFFNLVDGYQPASNKKIVIADIAEQYDGDYKRLGKLCGMDFSSDAREIVEAAIQKKQKNKVGSISGIARVDDRTVTITYKGKSKAHLQTLCDIYVAPLSGYGDISLYNYKKESFGFTKNDVAKQLENTSLPAGGGAYQLVDTDDTTWHFTANDHYYKGTPAQISLMLLNLDFDDMSQVLASKAADMVLCDLTKDLCIKFSDDTKAGRLYTIPRSGYVYLGMNGEQLKVGANLESKKSISLRRGFMTVFTANLAASVEDYYSGLVAPLSSSSTAPERESSEKLEETDVNRILPAVIKCFQTAGYTYDEAKSKFTAAPDGASLSYTVSVIGLGSQEHAAYQMLKNTSDTLSLLGITLEIIDEPNSSTLWKHVSDGSSQLWIFNYPADTDSLQENSYHLKKSTMNGLTSDRLSELQVELPLFRKQTALLCSDSVILPENAVDSLSSGYSIYSMIEGIQINPGDSQLCTDKIHHE